jgi:hypothetical protein
MWNGMELIRDITLIYRNYGHATLLRSHLTLIYINLIDL